MSYSPGLTLFQLAAGLGMATSFPSRLGHLLREARDALVTIVFPRACEVCGALIESLRNGPACKGCWETTRQQVIVPACLRCGYPSAIGGGIEPLLQCRRCAGQPYDFCRSIGPYEGALKAAIIELKTRPSIPAPLRELLLEAYDREAALEECETMVPVPLHRVREAERGFNQAAVIAEALARGHRIRLEQTLLVRARETAKHRAGMDAKDRARSVEGAFGMTRHELVAGRTVLLIDDVYTTGATVSACARTLKEAGAARVCVLTSARVTGGGA